MGLKSPKHASLKFARICQFQAEKNNAGLNLNFYWPSQKTEQLVTLLGIVLTLIRLSLFGTKISRVDMYHLLNLS